MSINEIRISGYSDDLVEVDGFISDEFSPPMGKVFEADLIAPGGDGVTVTAFYLKSGTWTVGVAPLDEDRPIPDWPMSIGRSPGCAYSSELTITVPDGTTLTPKEDN